MIGPSECPCSLTATWCLKPANFLWGRGSPEAGAGSIRHSTPADAVLSVPFLREVTTALNANEPPLRFTTDVSCSVGNVGWCPMISNCALTASSGVNRIMQMGTCEYSQRICVCGDRNDVGVLVGGTALSGTGNVAGARACPLCSAPWDCSPPPVDNAGSFDGWLQRGLAPAIDSAVPRASVGAGLGVWNDSKTDNGWNLTPKSAAVRVRCALITIMHRHGPSSPSSPISALITLVAKHAALCLTKHRPGIFTALGKWPKRSLMHTDLRHHEAHRLLRFHPPLSSGSDRVYGRATQVCAIMNQSLEEIDVFILSQGDPDPLKNYP